MISSHRNPLIKQIKRLKQRKYREQEQLFWTEGIRPVLSAAEADRVAQIVYAPDLLTSEIALQKIDALQQAGIPCTAVEKGIFTPLSERDNPAGLGALVKARYTPLDHFPHASSGLFIALFGISDPGNLGTILRTLDAAGGHGLILVGNCTDPFHPAAVKASMGTLFRLPVARLDNEAQLWSWCEKEALHTVATSARATTSFRTLSHSGSALLMLGSERHGLPETALAKAATAVSIPMLGDATSLNLAVAAGILLYALCDEIATDTISNKEH